MNTMTPTHYSCLGIQPFEIMRADFSREQYVGFLTGCILKRLLRWRLKDGVLDLRKARHELDELIRFETEAELQPQSDTAEHAPLQIGDKVCFIADTIKQHGAIVDIDSSSQQVVVLCKGQRFVVPSSDVCMDIWSTSNG